jgi:hypothetical protein
LSSAAARFMPPSRATASNTRRSLASIAGTFLTLARS